MQVYHQLLQLLLLFAQLHLLSSSVRPSALESTAVVLEQQQGQQEEGELEGLEFNLLLCDSQQEQEQEQQEQLEGLQTYLLPLICD